MKHYRKNYSIRRIIIIVFMLFMLVSICGIGYLIFSRWLFTAEQITKSISEDICDSINSQLFSFIHTPDHINETNHKIIENGIVNLSDEILREKFFVSILSSQNDEIYSFSYGTANGEYYGARRNENGVIEIMRNNATTGGNSWYYSVNENLTAGEIAVKAGQFDPRTRAWYKAAEEAGSPSYSPIYKHFVMNDLTISAAWPIYDENGKLNGVLGTHMLLSDIQAFLGDTVNKYNGYAIIFEKNSRELIANSMGVENFTVLQENMLRRYNIEEIQNIDIKNAYKYHQANHEPFFEYESENGKLFVNTREINLKGLDWVIMSVIPERLYMTDVARSIQLTILLVVLSLMLSLIIYNVVTGRLLKPMNSLLQVSEALSSGDLSKRVREYKNDEIGVISESLNKVADKMQYLINNLEANVKDRTEELHNANIRLEENKNQLRLILDSAAEAIYGIDLNGNCTFCNISCIKLLGYKDQDELLGKNMHYQIHYSRSNGTPLSAEECRIYQAIREKKGIHADDEVFWRADGTSFEVEYHSFPQIKNGEVIGGVITFMDITDRKQKEAEIKYLSCHDTLTGLHNRRCFEENFTRINIPDNLPISIIFADINGLKITNDIFGHAAGDELIKKSAEILIQSCRENDLIARVGGDEFIILLPRTNQENVEKVVSRIKSGFLDARVEAIKCSISIGSDTKTNMEQSLEEIMANAENAMYKDKTMNRESVNKDIINTIIETLHSKSSGEKNHSNAVSETEINKLKRIGYLLDRS